MKHFHRCAILQWPLTNRDFKVHFRIRISSNSICAQQVLSCWWTCRTCRRLSATRLDLPRVFTARTPQPITEQH